MNRSPLRVPPAASPLGRKQRRRRNLRFCACYRTANNRLMTPRRFPPPWTIEEYNDACFIVRDKSGQGLGYFYFEEESGRREAANLLTKDEARRLAVNFAKLPELLQGK